MRMIWLAVVVAAFGCGLAAQRIKSVVHEPAASDVGPYIVTQLYVNPNYDPLQPNGEPQFLPVYGNGQGIYDELDSISGEMYALAATTTHDLIVLSNNATNAVNMIIDCDPTSVTYISVSSIRPKNNVAAAPEQDNPGFVTQTIYGCDGTSLNVPAGSTVAAWLVVTRWFDLLDTSPREYIVTFQYNDLTPVTGGLKTVEVPLIVPEVRGGQGGGCVVSGDRSLPMGVTLIAGGAAVALISRRKRLRRA